MKTEQEKVFRTKEVILARRIINFTKDGKVVISEKLLHAAMEEYAKQFSTDEGEELELWNNAVMLLYNKRKGDNPEANLAILEGYYKAMSILAEHYSITRKAATQPEPDTKNESPKK